MMINKVVGTGGIGTGMIFRLEGQHTLGRDESRLAFLTEYRDYCKQHIILHYIARLSKSAGVYAIGKVGDDDQGKILISEMAAEKININFIEKTDLARTMMSVAFQYPDNSGGNITTSNSACNLVTPEYIERYSSIVDEKTLIIAVPEVPLESRIKLLEIGRNRGSFNVASVLSGEVKEFEKRNSYILCDLLAINIDEAASISSKSGMPDEIANAAIKKITALNPGIKLIITCGKCGCYTYSNKQIEKVPIIDVPVVSTAGAGDAFLGGAVAGLLNGMQFQKGTNDMKFGETPLMSATELGTIVSTFAVMSPDTIAKDVTAENIQNFISRRGYKMSEVFGNGI